MISIKGCRIEYDRVLIDEANIDIYDQEITLIRGDNGSGKTSLLYVIGLLSSNSCQYEFDNVLIENCNKNNIAEIRKKEIGYVFQDNNLLNHFTVYENFEYYAKLLNKSISRDEASSCLKQFNLDIPLDKYPDEISGGQKQRLSIALATIKNPRLIILDEPTSALDDKNTLLVIDMLKNIKQEKDCMIVVVSHDRLMKEVADRVYYIEDKGVTLEKFLIESSKLRKTIDLNSTTFPCYWYLIKYMKYFKKFYMFIISLLIVAISVTVLGNNYFENYSKRFVEAVERVAINEIVIEKVDNISSSMASVKGLENIGSITNVKKLSVPKFSVNNMENNNTMYLQTYSKYQPLGNNSNLKESDSEGIYVNYYFAKGNNINVNDIIMVNVQDKDIELKVTGILNQGVEYKYNSLDIPHVYLPENSSFMEETNVLLVYCQDITNIQQTASDIGNTLNNVQLSYDFRQISAYIDIINTTKLTTQWFSIILICITIIVVTLVFFKNTRLRKYEFALLRANGLTNRDIMILSCETSLVLLLILIIGSSILSLSILVVCNILKLNYFIFDLNMLKLGIELSIVSFVLPTILSTIMSITYAPSKVLRS